MNNPSYLKSTNEFVFHDNNEFIAFQQRFVIKQSTGEACEASDGTQVLKPSTECDFIHMTFMQSSSPYKLINNRAFYFKGYKEIIIQGARSNGENPTIEVYNEQQTGVYCYQNVNGEHCHSFDHDDSIFNIQNEHDNPVSVTISDVDFKVDFKLPDVERKRLYCRWYNQNIKPVFIKVYEADSFKMFNVKMFSQFLNLTHVFLHWCENVDITNCEFVNYNARIAGGNLWLWETARNVKVVNNVFRKYGNDENIAIWASSIMNKNEDNCFCGEGDFDLNSIEFANRSISLDDILIKGNRFYYGKPSSSPSEEVVDGPVLTLSSVEPITPMVPLSFPDAVNMSQIDNEEQWNGAIDVLHTIYVVQNINRSGQIIPYVHYNLSNVSIIENEYYIDSPANTIMSISLDDFCETNNIVIRNNVIKHGSWAKNGVVLQDFKIAYDWTDLESTSTKLVSNKMNLNPIYIENNTINSKALPYVDEDSLGHFSHEHIILNIESANVEFNNNLVIEDNRETNLSNRIPIISDESSLGYRLLYSRNKGGRINMRNNYFEGIRQMASFRFPSDNTFSTTCLLVSNNTFKGNVCSLFEHLQDGFISLVKNFIITSNSVLLFNGLPAKSTVVLKDNNIGLITIDNAQVIGTLYYPNDNDRVSTPDVSLTCVKNTYYNLSETIYPNQTGFRITVLDEKFIH